MSIGAQMGRPIYGRYTRQLTKMHVNWRLRRQIGNAGAPLCLAYSEMKGTTESRAAPDGKIRVRQISQPHFFFMFFIFFLPSHGSKKLRRHTMGECLSKFYEKKHRGQLHVHAWKCNCQCYTLHATAYGIHIMKLQWVRCGRN